LIVYGPPWIIQRYQLLFPLEVCAREANMKSGPLHPLQVFLSEESRKDPKFDWQLPIRIRLRSRQPPSASNALGRAAGQFILRKFGHPDSIASILVDMRVVEACERLLREVMKADGVAELFQSVKDFIESAEPSERRTLWDSLVEVLVGHWIPPKLRCLILREMW
jgi:hypothetical protein